MKAAPFLQPSLQHRRGRQDSGVRGRRRQGPGRGQSLVQVLAMRLGRVNLPDGFDEIDAEVLENSRFFPCPADWAS